MLSPKRVKHRKNNRGRRRGMSRGQVTVQFGEYGLKSLEQGWLTNRQIEAARIAMTRKIKRGGEVWINVFPDKPVTKKPAETRMGSGKGTPEGWVAVVKPGRVMFELAGVPEPLAREAIRLAAHKLPVKSKFVLREDCTDEGQGDQGHARRGTRRGTDDTAQGLVWQAFRKRDRRAGGHRERRPRTTRPGACAHRLPRPRAGRRTCQREPISRARTKTETDRHG